jgi:hypothetical protein
MFCTLMPHSGPSVTKAFDRSSLYSPVSIRVLRCPRARSLNLQPLYLNLLRGNNPEALGFAFLPKSAIFYCEPP